jgi:hypothetical protein
MSSKIAWFERILPVGALLAPWVLIGVAGCGMGPFGPGPEPAAPASAEPALAAPEVVAEPFSTERAWAHLVALSDLGPRPAGSAANRQALEYIRSRLEELDLELIDIEYTAAPEEADGEPRVLMSHLSARIPGESPDSIMLLAHYDTFDRSPGANHGASGPAVLLELARQLTERPLPYTVELVFLDGDMGYFDEAPDEPLSEGGHMMAGYLSDAGTLDIVRLAVLFGQVCDVDLTIGRDLHSQRVHRETFFEVAEDLGYGASFPRGRGYVESAGSHRALTEAGMPRVVWIHDPWYGGDTMPGEYYGGPDDVRDHCAPQSLHTVGVVTLAALRQISARLEKIDHVSGRAERRRAEALERARLEEESIEDTTPLEGEAMPEGDEAAEPAAEMQPGEAAEPAAEMQPEGGTSDEGASSE